ncbi:hypothetical protein Lser_V15G00016 [Lactuca serriola]
MNYSSDEDDKPLVFKRSSNSDRLKHSSQQKPTSISKQGTNKLIFEKPPPNVRKIVLATNIDEASITINDVVLVVDCGIAKETTYDASNNTPCLLPSWISQASARQRRGRARRVQTGECLEVGSIGEFLSAALLPPEPLAVQNVVDFSKMIGALYVNENLTHLDYLFSFFQNIRKYMAMLPLDPKLGKMLIMGAFFRCFDPILTIVPRLSVRDHFLLPQENKDQASTTKSIFSAKDYSDHMTLRNFLSAQTLQAIHSLRNQFSHILKDAQLLETKSGINNRLSHNQSLVSAIICSGLFPGIASVVHRETSMSFETIDDVQVLLYAFFYYVGGGEVQYHGEVARLKVDMKIVKG